MKFVRVQITDSMHARLKALASHHGEYTHLVRKAIREFVNKEEENRYYATPRETPKRTDSKVEG